MSWRDPIFPISGIEMEERPQIEVVISWAKERKGLIRPRCWMASVSNAESFAANWAWSCAKAEIPVRARKRKRWRIMGWFEIGSPGEDRTWKRCRRPCPEQLVESELFGHRKGAFTGADEHRAGLFEVADGGTLFLDEIGELPKSLQSRLLRVLESGEIRRVGDSHPITVDVRVVCATHRTLEEMVAAGDFREDLLFRINTFEVAIPPLRERLDDLPSLVNHFIRKARPQTPVEAAVVDSEVLAVLSAHRWPGNIRELANVIEHALVLCDELPLTVEQLPARLGGMVSRPPAAALMAPHLATTLKATSLRVGESPVQPSARPISLRELEMQAIREGLARNQGNKVRTAEELGISLKTLYNKLHQLQDGQQEKPVERPT